MKWKEHLRWKDEFNKVKQTGWKVKENGEKAGLEKCSKDGEKTLLWRSTCIIYVLLLLETAASSGQACLTVVLQCVSLSKYEKRCVHLLIPCFSPCGCAVCLSTQMHMRMCVLAQEVDPYGFTLPCSSPSLSLTALCKAIRALWGTWRLLVSGSTFMCQWVGCNVCVSVCTAVCFDPTKIAVFVFSFIHMLFHVSGSWCTVLKTKPRQLWLNLASNDELRVRFNKPERKKRANK